MICRDVTAVYCESNTEHINIMCEKSAEFLSCNAGGIRNYHEHSQFILCFMTHKAMEWHGVYGTALAILNSILYKKDVVSPVVHPPYSLDRKLTGSHGRCARSGEELLVSPQNQTLFSIPLSSLCTDEGNHVSCHSSAVSRWPFI